MSDSCVDAFRRVLLHLTVAKLIRRPRAVVYRDLVKVKTPTGSQTATSDSKGRSESPMGSEGLNDQELSQQDTSDQALILENTGEVKELQYLPLSIYDVLTVTGNADKSHIKADEHVIEVMVKKSDSVESKMSFTRSDADNVSLSHTNSGGGRG